MSCSIPFRALALAALLPCLAACGTLSAIGDAATPLDVIVLSTPDDLPTRTGPPLARDVIIEEPTASGALATDRIMIQPGALQAEYLPDTRWSDTAPVLIQTLMVQALDSTNGFQYVGRRPLGPGGDFAVVTEIVAFQARLLPDGSAAEVEVRLVSRIVRERGATVVATRTFAASERAESLDDLVLAEAFDRATGRVIWDFTAWVLTSLGAI